MATGHSVNSVDGHTSLFCLGTNAAALVGHSGDSDGECDGGSGSGAARHHQLQRQQIGLL